MKRLLLILGLFISSSGMAQLTGLTLTGNPESLNGATWTYQQTINGTSYDLTGILFKPVGSGVFPAVIINHGTGGNVNGYSKNVAKKMVQWNYTCIAVNLCHSAGAPIGSPGDSSLINFGASTNNYLRDMKCWDILASLNYVDTNCIMAFGHSRGAYLTTGLVATYPDKFRAAGHTAGGVSPQLGFSAPTTMLAAQISCPYIIHHGDADNTVPIEMDSLLNSVFNSTGIPHQFYQYSGYTHSSISMDSLMFARTQQWFALHGCANTTSINQQISSEMISIFPNPTSDFIQFKTEKRIDVSLFDVSGKLLLSKIVMPNEQINVSQLNNGIYFITINLYRKMFHHKIIIQK
ncbi:MAG TPA: T9SS type A sorting domain-containing protein [Bacteroidia bacterium]|nr:T9SS type A sorting domain-containing protein [Bacteroidia bacterium]MBP7715424.1 T9SS type A sorting domain-containing protein [Bacteroidia bacterium]MBP8669457.1 T9SS type A sorting domain-containing protein [Bacteroidia bacterium]HOZ89922.1 T9SS type A sorting domain-containing protein [Bacteroidia bacterium]HQW18089.1 T9SS type A sorting domain-containing protein [Bacteroidia bacterium]